MQENVLVVSGLHGNQGKIQFDFAEVRGISLREVLIERV